jgi:hypothetical protein
MYTSVYLYREERTYCDRKYSLSNMSELEGQIDNLVYELYGLTPEEIEIVEGR